MTTSPDAAPAGSPGPTEAHASQAEIAQITPEARRQSVLVANADGSEVEMLDLLDAALGGIDEWSA